MWILALEYVYNTMSNVSKSLLKKVAGLYLILAGLLSSSPESHATIIFDLNDGLGVSSSPSGPPNPTVFTLTSPDYISLIDVYHYNDPSSDTVSIYEGATLIGSYSATVGTYYAGTLGQPNLTSTLQQAPYYHLQATPDVSLPAGTYTIKDANASTWSYNSASGNEGITTIGDGTVPEPAVASLLGLGLVGVLAGRRRKTSASA